MTNELYIGHIKNVTKRRVNLSHDIHEMKKGKNGKLMMKTTSTSTFTSSIQARNLKLIWKCYLEWVHFDNDPVKFG